MVGIGQASVPVSPVTRYIELVGAGGEAEAALGNIGRLSQTHAVPFAAVPARPTRSVEAAARWQDRLDRLVLVSAATAVAGVALQTLEKSGPVHIVGLIAGAAGGSFSASTRPSCSRSVQNRDAGRAATPSSWCCSS
jgi:hypothetical protein